MSDLELIAYYVNLLILQYADKPRAVATVASDAELAIMNQIPLKVKDAFDLETAIGVQLDVVGKYAGVKRTGNTFTGQITLNDDDFRLLIKLAIIKNNSDSSLATIDELLNTYFPETIKLFDHGGMRISYFVNSTGASQDLVQMFITNGLLPVPMAVQQSSTIYAPELNRFYGFRTYKSAAFNNSPMNNYPNYHMDYPWLSYSLQIGAPNAFDESMLTEDGFRLVQEDGSLLFI